MKHILLVDDVSTNLKCEEHILHDRYKVTMVKSGEDALRYLEEQTPDMILLDIYLRKMNGYEVMEHMQKSPHLAKIPVILLTAAEGRRRAKHRVRSGRLDPQAFRSADAA